MSFNIMNYNLASVIVQNAWRTYRFNLKYKSIENNTNNIKHIISENKIIYYKKTNGLILNYKSYLLGVIPTIYNDIENIFGTPSIINEEEDEKVNTEWIISTIIFDMNKKTFERIVFSIYNWKTQRIPYNNYDWHISGHNEKAYEVAKYLICV